MTMYDGKCSTTYKQALPEAIGTPAAPFSLTWYIESDVSKLLKMKGDNAKGRHFVPLPSF